MSATSSTDSDGPKTVQQIVASGLQLAVNDLLSIPQHADVRLQQLVPPAAGISLLQNGADARGGQQQQQQQAGLAHQVGAGRNMTGGAVQAAAMNQAVVFAGTSGVHAGQHAGNYMAGSSGGTAHQFKEQGSAAAAAVAPVLAGAGAGIAAPLAADSIDATADLQQQQQPAPGKRPRHS
jgi:hypothetical protein